MASCREPFSYHGDYAAGNTGNGTRDLHIVRNADVLSAGFLCLILPGNAEQVQRIDIPQTNILQAFCNLLGRMLRMDHLIDRRNKDLILFCLFNVVLQVLFVDAQINLYHDSISFPDSLILYSFCVRKRN